MKKFKHRPGVELLKVSTEYLLVATGEARGHCNYVTQINQSAAEYWQMIDQTYSIRELAAKAAEYYHTETKKVLLNVMVFVNKMTQSGYLIEVEE